MADENSQTEEMPSENKLAGGGVSNNFGSKRIILLIVLPVAFVLGALIVYLNSGRFKETDNAYLQSDIVPISSEVSGIIRSLSVIENQHIEEGELIFELDDAPFVLEVDKAKAKLQAVAVDLNVLKSSYDEMQANINLSKSNVAFAKKELARQKDLKGKNFVSESTLDDLEHAVDIAEQQLTVLKLDLKKIEASLGGSVTAPITSHPQYLGAIASLRSAELDLEKTKVSSPSSGYVSQLPKRGAFARAGSMLAALVSDKKMWVEANFPETDLTYVKNGQHVDIHIDTYPSEVWEGKVESISPATGAEFAILPPQNATGNWVKVAQRFPVRIELILPEQSSPLRVGMSAVVEIDTEHKKSFMGLSF